MQKQVHPESKDCYEEDDFVWNMIQAVGPMKKLYLPGLSSIEGIEKLESIVEEFERQSLPSMEKHLKRAYVHGDLNDQNLVVDQEGSVIGVVDFDDVAWSYPIVDLATAMMYVAVGVDTSILLEKLNLFYKSYCSIRQLTDVEKSLLYNLILMRFVQSTAVSLYQNTYLDPGNDYLLLNVNANWKRINYLLSISKTTFMEEVCK